MRARLYTVHEKRGAVRVVADRFHLVGFLLPPLWAIWHGLWITLAAQMALLLGAGLWSPLAPAPVALGISLILGFEGGAVRRAELALRGWRRAGVVEARSAAGAEELWLTGEVA